MPMPIQQFLTICESKLVECNDPSNAPMHLSPEQATVYQQARRELLQWVLEMLT